MSSGSRQAGGIASLREQAAILRAEGLTHREIGERMGVPLTTAANWILDPDLSKQRARRVRYAGTCERCGNPTDGSGGFGSAPTVCMDCLRWTDEAIIEAMQNWAKDHGKPPTCADWQNVGATYPCAQIVCSRIGWNAALQRAGLPIACDRFPETQAQIESGLRDGRRVVDIAAEIGVTP